MALLKSPVVIQWRSRLIMLWSWGIYTTISERETNEQLDQARYVVECVMHSH